MADENLAVEVALRAQTRQYVRAMARAEEATKDFQKQLKTSNIAKFNAGLERLSSAALRISAATAVVGTLVQEVVQAGLEFERLNKILIAATGSASAANAEYIFLSKTFNELGLSIRETGEEYARFQVAAQSTFLQGQLARDVFVNLSTALSGLGSTSENTSAVFDQLVQVIAKPTTQLEDLLVIAERVPGTFQALADSLNLPISKIFELVSAGELTAEQWLIPFSEIMAERIPESADTAQQAFNNLGNAIFELQVAISQAGLLDAVGDLSEGLTQAVRNLTFLVEQIQGVRELGNAFKESAFVLLNVLVPGFAGLTAAYDELSEQQREYVKTQQEAAEIELERAESVNERARLEVELGKAIDDRAKLQKQAEEQALKASQDRLEQAAKDNIAAQRDYLNALKRRLREGERLEEQYADKVKSLRQELADFDRTVEEQAREARLASLSEKQRQAAILDEISQKEIEYSQAVLAGQYERARAAAEEALELSNQIENARERKRIQEEATRTYRFATLEQIKVTEEQRKVQERQNAETQKSIDEQIKKITELKNELKEFTSEPQIITIDADVTSINQKIDEIEQRLKELDATIAAGGRAGGGAIGFASGGAPRMLRPGMIRGPGTSTSDSILARVSAGEHAFITKASRARKLWPLLNTLNFGSDSMVREVLDNLPSGLGRASRPAPIAGGFARGGSVGGEMQPINIMLPGSSRPAAQLFGERDEVTAFEDALARWSRGYAS